MGKTILDEAAAATDGARPGQYGHPLDHFTRSVAMFNARFADRLKAPFTVEDWPIVMIIEKLARHAHCGQRDSLVDIAGWARTIEMVEEERARRARKPGNGHAHTAVIVPMATGEPVPQADGQP